MSDLDKTLQALTYYKQADSSPSFREALQNYYSQGLRAAALHRALGIGAAGLGVGLGARGLLGLLNLGKGNIAPEEPYASSLVDLGEEKEEKEAGAPDWYGSETSQYAGDGGRSGDEELPSGIYHGIQIGEKDSIPSGLLSKLFPKGRQVGRERVPDIIAALKKIKGVDVPDEVSDDLVEFGWGVNDEVPYEGTPEMREAIEEALFPEKEAGVPKGGLSFSSSRLTSDEFEAKHKKEKKKRKRKSRYKKAGILDFLKGEYAETTKGVPWAIPAAVGAGAGGLYGGWKLMDYVLDQRRKQNLDEELETAKAEYEAALSGADKEAADGSLAADLDQLYDNISEYGEKAAASWPELGGQAAGVYGAGAGVGALVMALLGYKQGRKKQRRRILARAQARKRREEYQRRPDPLYVRAGRSSELAPTVEDESSDASPSLDEIEDQLL